MKEETSKMKTNKNRKNWVVRIMSITLLFTLISACLMSGTLAKYTTGSDTKAGDTARVAKWGVDIKGSGMELFKSSYLPDVEYDPANDDSDYADYTVASINFADNLVAPGTRYDDAAFVEISGEPEVACEIAFDFGTLKNAKALEEYDPIIWYWDINGDKQFGKFEDLEEVLKDERDPVQVAPNTDLSELFNGDFGFSIGWAWLFEKDDYDDFVEELGDDYTPVTGFVFKQDDKLDTELGDAVANATSANLADFEISIPYGVTITQID